MATPSSRTTTPPDQPYVDTMIYGNGPDDAVTDATEHAAITHHRMGLGGKTLAYTATAGHLTIIDPSNSRPAATLFSVAFTADTAPTETRPVTFFYNGGPGASSVFLLLGSFAPKRIKTQMPSFTPPAPYTLEDNPESLLDKSDLVFINPVGTGYSAAIAPYTNKEFWGVDQDAKALRQFIKRYLTANDRWNSPKFLFGESYGTARSCVLAYLLHEDGVDLNGVILQSSILDYTQAGNPVGLLPTLAADAWYHQRITVTPPPPDLPTFLDTVVPFAQTAYAAAVGTPPSPPDLPSFTETILTLSAYTGISPVVLISWGLNMAASNNIGLLFLQTLVQDAGRALGAYDGRVTGIDTGIAATIDPHSGSNDPTMTAVSGVYTVMWNRYLNDDLQYTSTSAFTDLNDQTFAHWDFSHLDPTGAQKGVVNGNLVLYTAGDLAAAMALNVDLKVFAANGYFDAVTPFSQTILDLQTMPLVDPAVRDNLTIKSYPSGHMIYLDGASRTAMKADLAVFYDRRVAEQATSHVRRARYLSTVPIPPQ